MVISYLEVIQRYYLLKDKLRENIKILINFLTSQTIGIVII